MGRLAALSALMLATLAACAFDDAARPPEVVAKPVSATRTPEPPKGPPPRLRKLFVRDRPSPFVVADKLAFGMSADEARRAAPALFGPTPLRPDGLDDVTLSVELDQAETVAALVARLPRSTALASLMDLWGEPAKGYEPTRRSTVYWWFDAEARIRARLVDDGSDASRLVVDGYLPLDELFGGAGDHFPFERESILGTTGESAAKTLSTYFPKEPGYDLCRSELLLLPSTDYDAANTRVLVDCDDKKVVGFDILVRFAAYIASKDTILAALRRKLGPPASRTDVFGAPVLDYARPGRTIRFRADDKFQDVVVEIKRAKSK